MKKQISTIIIALFYLTSFGQSNEKTDAMTLVQLKKNFSESKGFEQYLYGTSIKKYKGFKLIPTQEVFKQYGSNISFKYIDIQIDSIQLFFYKNKLYTIELFIKKSEREKMTIALEKLYGPKSPMLSEGDEYIWSDYNKNKREISIYPVGETLYAVHFENLENKNEMMKESLDKLLK